MARKFYRFLSLTAIMAVVGINGCSDAEDPPATHGDQQENEDSGVESEQEPACVPGETQPCYCEGGLATGAQACATDGMSWNTCECSQEQPQPELICEPGETQACNCQGSGTSGAQSCREDGLGWTLCVCPEPESAEGEGEGESEGEGEGEEPDYSCFSWEDCPAAPSCMYLDGCIFPTPGEQGVCDYRAIICPVGAHCEFNQEGSWCDINCRDYKDCPAGWTCGQERTCQQIPEICDGLDNNFDGKIDEGYAVGQPCPGSSGVCAVEGVWECRAGGYSACSTDGGGSDSQFGPEICDGLDNNCDGEVDEGVCP